MRLSRSDTARIIEGTRRRRATHNENRPYVARRLYDLLAARYKNAAIRAYREQSIDSPTDNVTSIFDRDSALDTTIASTLARGEPTPEGWEQELRIRFRGRPEVKEALERMWPVLSGAELVNDLFGFRALVRSASGSLLNDDEQELLHRRRDPDVRFRHDEHAGPKNCTGCGPCRSRCSKESCTAPCARDASGDRSASTCCRAG